MHMKEKQSGFTIVELLIVIVVIGILAGITIIAFNGVLRKATIATLQSDLANATKVLKSAEITNGVLPSDTTSLRASTGVTYQYTFNAATIPQTFCVTATKDTLSYYITQVGGEAIAGACPGHIANGGPIPNSFTTLTVTARAGAGIRDWKAVASSADGTKLVAVAQSSVIVTSNDSGATWTSQTNSGSRSWSSVTMSADGTKIAATVTNGYIYTSANSGIDWTERQSATIRNWSSIDGSTDGTKLIAGAAASAAGGVSTSTDSGVTWTTRTTAVDIRSVATSNSGDTLIAAQYGSYLRKSTDGGVTWSSISGMGGANWAFVTCSSTCATLLAGTFSSSSFYSTDGGATRITGPFGTLTLQAGAISDDGTKLVGAPRYSSTRMSLDSGSVWAAQASVPSRIWSGAAMSSDGAKFVLAPSSDDYTIYTGSWQ
jgi:prepilin-type N-terminal cleavage/methylation domain-containing protein